MIGVGAGQQSRVDCVKLAGRKVATWWLRQHPKVRGLAFASTAKRQARVNARVDVPFYLEHGYVSSEAAEKATSYTLSYSFDDFVLAGLSRAVGESDAAEAAALRA